jgi:ketosteroid isomerase-like protein
MSLRRGVIVLIVVASIFRGAAALAEPVTTIRDNGSPSNRVDIVILGDGYTAAELSNGKYASDVEGMLARLFFEEPYPEYQLFFNIYRIDVTSNESGADHPSRGVYRDTALGAFFDCGGIQRLLCANLGAVNNVLARSIVDPNARDIVILLVNDPNYGGWGGSIAIASTNVAAAEIVLHELGHSFAFLADEYGGPPPPSCAVYETSAANATAETRRNAIKWKAWIDSSTTPIPTVGPSTALPGLYEGAAYCDRGMFRPTYNSKMRTLGTPFEQINVEAHVKRIYNLVSPIEAVSPEPGPVQVRQGETTLFSVRVLSPMTHGMDIVWSVDDTPAGSDPVFRFAASDFSPGLHTLTVTVADPTPFVRNDPAGLLRASETWSVEVLGPMPVGGMPRAVPGTIEAEDFDAGGEGVAYHDTTPSNDGGEYRDTDVDIARTADGGGGYVVGWMPAGEWLAYTISVAESRTYTLTARVAASGPGGTFHVEVDGVDRTGPLTIPNTGGWQSWTDVTATVTLDAGIERMRVVADSMSPAGVFGNLNYVRFVASSGSGSMPLGGAPRPVPGTIEAEDFDAGGEGVAYHDATPSNAGGEYRDTDVDIERTADGGGGYNVGWMPAGEWLDYTISVPESRTYTLTARVAANGPGGTFHVEFDGVNGTGPLTIPDTGGWQSWTDVTATVTLNTGVQLMRVVADSSSPAGVFGNLNYLRFAASGESGSTPFGGAPRPVPGTIQAEDFDAGGEGIAYHDTTTSNDGGEYRDTDVDIERTADGGGYNVGWMPAGEWLNYTISVPESRTYTLTARVAANGPGGTFHVEFDGVNRTGPLTIPDTGGWQSWTDVTATVTLNAGVQRMSVVADSNRPTGVFGNLNYVTIAVVTGAAPADVVVQSP